MKKPKVSVIIPTYNRANMIEETIQSVLNQTFQDFEIIIVDDASTDSTENIVKGFSDKRIKYIQHKVNKGGSAARNTGIKASTGKFIAFLDSDDWWHPKKLENQLTKMETSKLSPALVYTGLKQVNNDGKLIKEIIPIFRGNIFQELLIENVVGTTSSVLLRKEIFNSVGLFDENLPSRQDLDLWLRIARKYTFDYVKTPLVYIRIHKNRITEDLNMKINSRKLLFNKIYDELKRDRRKIARYFYETGILYLRVGNMAAGRRYLLKAFSTFPHFKTISALGVSLLGFEGFRLILKVTSFLKLWSIVKTFRKFIIKTISLLRNKIS
ncbi:glycosyltransferase [candidate division WOR-3 bacterium]|nr:glycosyltransferase [candidate division WOR-3 bacterium]